MLITEEEFQRRLHERSQSLAREHEQAISNLMESFQRFGLALTEVIDAMTEANAALPSWHELTGEDGC